jgi:hypothetical protein
MADFGAPVAANVNTDPTRGLQTISSLMGLQQQKQALEAQNLDIQQKQLGLQSTGLDIQSKQATLPATQSESSLKVEKNKQAKAFSDMLKSGVDDNGQSLKGADGEYDLAKVVMAAGRVAPLAPEIAQQQIKTHSDKVALQSAALSLQQGQNQMLQGPVQALQLDPSDQNVNNARATIQGLVEQHPEMAPAAGHVNSLLDILGKQQDPNKRREMAGKLSALIQPGAPVQTQPAAASVSAGNSTMQGTTAPPLAGGGFTPTSNVNLSPSPAIIIDANGQPHYVGMAKSADPGVDEGFAGRTEVEGRSASTADMTNHFASLNTRAQSMPLVEGLTRTIQGLAPTAFTGVGAERKQYLAGLADAFGVKLTGNSQTDTNLLNKAIAQLNLASPAATDAGKTLVQAAQPNSHMDKAAILEAAGTVRAQLRMDAAERDFLHTQRYSNGGAGDPERYQEGRAAFEANADPRIWQFEELVKSDPNAAKAFIARQPDKAELIKKAKSFEAMGFFK